MPTLGGSTAGAVYADRGAWLTATAYVVGDVVTNAAARYLCRTAHTSGTFATDLAASRWVTIDATTLAVAGQEPVVVGTASVGASSATARADHVHPTDVLAYVEYSPPANITVSGSTFADVSAANLVVTFTAPTTGKVMVSLEAFCVGAGTTSYGWNLRDSGGNITGTIRDVCYNTTNNLRARATQVVSGLTPGQSYTWKWGHACTFGAGTSTFGGAGTGGATTAIMTVQAVR